MFKLFKNILLILLLTNLFACTYSPNALKEVYDEIPSDISDDIKQPIEATEQQSKMIDNYAIELMQWHRRNKLPEYSQTVEQLADLTSQENAPLHEIKKVLNKLKDIPHFQQAGHLTHKMSAIGRSLSTHQISLLEQHLTIEHQKELLEISNENHSADVIDLVKTVFQIIGVNLNESQITLIKTESRKFHDIRQYELKSEKLWNKQLIALLRKKNEPNFDAHFAKLWNEQDSKLTGKAYQLDQQNDHQMANLVKNLADSFEAEQRENLSQTLISVANTFNEMANE